MTHNSRLNFYGDLAHDVDTGIIKRNSYHCGIGTMLQILLVDKEIVDEFLMKVFEVWDVLLAES